MNIFISYSHRDKISALRIKSALVSAFTSVDFGSGVSIWLDDSSLQYGSQIDQEIEKSLLKSNLVLSLWSKSASESEGVAHEIQFAYNNRIAILPCFLDNTPPGNFAVYFEDRGIVFTPFKTGTSQLIEFIKEKYPDAFFN